jgi:hypothetical protein
MSFVIEIGNKSFDIGQTLEDNRRRKIYFDNPGTLIDGLTLQERELLKTLGIDSKQEQALKQYLPAFFEALPTCQTSSSLYLRKECEIPYFVLWSTKFADYTNTKARLDTIKQQDTSRTDLEVAQNSAIINDIKPIPESHSMIRHIFTLIDITSISPASPMSSVIPTAPPMIVPTATEKPSTRISSTETQPVTTEPKKSKLIPIIRQIFTLRSY